MFSVGQVIQATVKELMSFGIVMELAPDVSGLLHIRNLDHAYVSQLNKAQITLTTMLYMHEVLMHFCRIHVSLRAGSIKMVEILIIN